jgi:hypothetical protein
MKLYLVIETRGELEGYGDLIFGVFSSEEKANEIKNDLLTTFEENGETDIYVCIEELILDEVTDDYSFFMYNYN